MKKILFILGIALAVVGCTKDADVTPSGDNVLTITSNIATRVASGQWEDDEEIGVYMTLENADLGDLGANVKYTTSDGSGNFSSSTPLYYPASGKVEIFAYYPWVNGVNLTEYPIDSEDQVDLLSASEDNLASSSEAVKLTFNHLLSKVSLTIKAGDGLTMADFADLEVKLSGISTTANINILEPTALSLTNSNSELQLTTTITKNSEGTAITAVSSSAIVIPQDLTTATQTLYFTTKDFGTFSAALTTEKFNVGSEYTYTVTLNRDSVELSAANIDSWNGGDDNYESDTADLIDITYISGKYYINSAAGLKAFADLVNGEINTEATYYGFTFSGSTQTGVYGVLTRDIDLESVEWTPIGNDTNAYSGTFDGGGFLVSNLKVTGQSRGGLFGKFSSGSISNLGVSGSVDGSSTASSFIGGIVGHATGGTITNCYNTATVTGNYSQSSVGGIVGDGSCSIVACYNSGTITTTTVSTRVGGMAGQGRSSMKACYNIGTLTNNGYVECQVNGMSGYSSYVTYTACYSATYSTIFGSSASESSSQKSCYTLSNAADYYATDDSGDTPLSIMNTAVASSTGVEATYVDNSGGTMTPTLYWQK